MLPIKFKWKRMYQCISLERSALYLVLPQPCISRILAEKIGSLPLLTYGSPFITLYSSHTNTWFHWNFCFPLRTLQADSRGFLPLMGSEWLLCLPECVGVLVYVCVRCGHNTHTSLSHCHQLISEVTQAGLSSARPSPWCHRQWNEKHWLRKGNKKWSSVIAQLGKKGRFNHLWSCTHLFLDGWKVLGSQITVWMSCFDGWSCERLLISHKNIKRLCWQTPCC